jgi:F-type H+-transporting ATPase subunit c
MIIAEITGNIASAAGLIAAAIAVGMIGTKAAEAVGRNPAASGKILVQSILGMALAEGLGLLALFLAKEFLAQFRASRGAFSPRRGPTPFPV